MGEIVDFQAKKAEASPHRAGAARCLLCKHEWAAVSPVGTTGLQCPSCAGFGGIYKGLSATEYPQWQCKCGEYAFFIDLHGPYCAHCGVRPDLSWNHKCN